MHLHHRIIIIIYLFIYLFIIITVWHCILHTLAPCHQQIHLAAERN